MSDIINTLMLEHRNIEAHLTLLDKCSQKIKTGKFLKFKELESLILFLEFYVGHLHHMKEEKILFVPLSQSNKIFQGGPNCTFHMDMRLYDKIVEKINLFVKNLEPNVYSPSVDSEMALLIQNGSPLSIPIEEHIAGHTLIHYMKVTVKEILSGDCENDKLSILSQLIDFYSKLIRGHIKKEDDCLFEMARSVLGQTNLEALNSTAEVMEKNLYKKESPHFLSFSGLND